MRSWRKRYFFKLNRLSEEPFLVLSSHTMYTFSCWASKKSSLLMKKYDIKPFPPNTKILCCMLILKYLKVICYIKGAHSDAHINIHPTSCYSKALVKQPGPHSWPWEFYVCVSGRCQDKWQDLTWCDLVCSHLGSGRDHPQTVPTKFGA